MGDIPESIVTHIVESAKAMTEAASALTALRECREKDAEQNNQHWQDMITTLNSEQAVHKATSEATATAIIEASKNYKTGLDSLTAAISANTSESKEFRTSIVNAFIKIAIAAVAAVIILAGAKAVGIG